MLEEAAQGEAPPRWRRSPGEGAEASGWAGIREALKERGRARPGGQAGGGWRETELAGASRRGWAAEPPVLGRRGLGLDEGCPGGEGGWEKGSKRHPEPSAYTRLPPPPRHLGRLWSLQLCCHGEKNQPRSADPSTNRGRNKCWR